LKSIEEKASKKGIGTLISSNKFFSLVKPNSKQLGGKIGSEQMIEEKTNKTANVEN